MVFKNCFYFLPDIKRDSIEYLAKGFFVPLSIKISQCLFFLLETENEIFPIAFSPVLMVLNQMSLSVNGDG